MGHPYFKGRRLCIATKHGKELVIAPILEKALGVTAFVPENFDTDELGTFSGEVSREDTPLDTARRKCEMAMEQTGCDLVVASEGSFGSHPTLLFVPADEEFLVLMDKSNDLEIIARTITTETNLGGAAISTESELQDFAEKSLFPDHALIIKSSEQEWKFIQKGITDASELKSAFEECIQKFGNAYVETDMRAMLNPLRMKAISKTAEELKNKILSACPKCDFPGFSVVEKQPGLPCSQCGMPTRSTLNLIYRCANCSFERKESFPSGKTYEDPMYCDFCNP